MVATAVEIASAVRAGTLDPVRVTERALAGIEAGDRVVNAFRVVRTEEALEEAGAVAERADLAELPLAGVPVAVKDVVEVKGEYAAWGSVAYPPTSATEDHELVRRLRAAGAVIVGLTRVPELCVWPMSDVPGAITRNPWQPAYTAGGSSGGSAAAVAAGFVPVAHGTDGLGSVRLPSAMCGIVGIKPGADILSEGLFANRQWPGENDRPNAPSEGSLSRGQGSDQPKRESGTGESPGHEIGSARSSTDTEEGWFGLSAHGSHATTVSDAALMLSVLAGRPDFAEIGEPGELRVAVSTVTPLTHFPVPKPLRSAVDRVAGLLAEDGHRVERATPRYSLEAALGLVGRWFAGPAEQAATLDANLLQPRTRTLTRIGRAMQAAGLIQPGTRRRWLARTEEFFTRYDVLLTPTLGALPPKAERWHERSFLANMLPSGRVAPFTGLWNLAGYPAMSVPAARHPSGLPIGVQLVAPAGGESRLLALAARLERLNPWPRTP
ncbi:amidase [Amycolatopsis pigmentata]|uniref:Amidase n=1 Tax=Amycolatopsis pigmentata TaxID=450801 RepID=A0ABW5FWG3_9PSEU